MRATLRTVDFVEMLQWELELGCECLDTSTELACWKRREFVEKRLNDCWVKDDHRELKDKSGEEVSDDDRMGVGEPHRSIITQGTKRSPAHSKM